jgi:hypothetical protein
VFEGKDVFGKVTLQGKNANTHKGPVTSRVER